MSKQYLVKPMRQMSQMACVPTAVWMLHSWYLQKIGHSEMTPMFDAIVNVSAAQMLKPGNRGGPITGLDTANIADFARQSGLESASIEISPKGFETQLTKHGPFIFLNKVQQQSLPGALLLKSLRDSSQFAHVVLITGIEDRKSQSFVLFNDPGPGLSLKAEFFDFVLKKYPPLKGLDKSLVLYFK